MVRWFGVGVAVRSLNGVNSGVKTPRPAPRRQSCFLSTSLRPRRGFFVRSVSVYASILCVACDYQGSSPAASTARTITLTRVSDGSTLTELNDYIPGEAITVSISSTSGHYVLETSTDDWNGYPGNSCGLST